MAITNFARPPRTRYKKRASAVPPTQQGQQKSQQSAFTRDVNEPKRRPGAITRDIEEPRPQPPGPPPDNPFGGHLQDKPPPGPPPGPPPPKPPPGPPTPPPSSPETELARQVAAQNFQNSLSGINQSLYNAALDYGDWSPYQATIGGNPDFAMTGPVVTNPNSALAQIARAELEGKRQLAEGRNAQGTFFSGGHLRDIGNVEDQAMYDRTDAFRRYQSASQAMTQAYAQARQARDQALAQATIDDINAALAKKPEPKAPPPKKKPGGGGHGGGDHHGGGKGGKGKDLTKNIHEGKGKKKGKGKERSRKSYTKAIKKQRRKLKQVRKAERRVAGPGKGVPPAQTKKYEHLTNVEARKEKRIKQLKKRRHRA